MAWNIKTQLHDFGRIAEIKNVFLLVLSNLTVKVFTYRAGQVEEVELGDMGNITSSTTKLIILAREFYFERIEITAIEDYDPEFTIKKIKLIKEQD